VFSLSSVWLHFGAVVSFFSFFCVGGGVGVMESGSGGGKRGLAG
jgi:hypothetical protein